MTTTTTLHPALERLLDRLGDRAIVPGDPRYDDARAVWNGMIDARPAVVARAASTADVQEVVRLARESGLPLAVRGGGHNVAGFGTIDDGIVLDLAGFRSVEVDPEARIAVVGGGATIADLDRATQEHGLAAAVGVVGDTGVGGLTLSGGLGWLRRKHGAAVDNLIAADVVTADGSVRRAAEDGDGDPDLLWALRGGGGNVGVVTAFTFRLHPLGPDAWLTFTLYPLEAARDVLLGVEAYVRGAPEEVAPLAVLGRVPAAEAFPEEIHHAPYAAVLAPYAGPAEDGERETAALRRLAEPLADLSGAMPWVEVQTVLDEDYPPGLRYYWTSATLDAVTPATVDLLAEHAARAPSDHSTIDVWYNGGALARVPEGATAFTGRSAPYLVGIEANWERPEEDAANVAWARTLLADLRREGSAGLYLNFAGLPEEAAAATRAGHGRAYDRLAELKARYDPGNLFRHNQNVPPAA